MNRQSGLATKYQTSAVQPLLTLIDPLISGAQRVMELGCGTGRLVNALAERYPDLEELRACDIGEKPRDLNPKVKFSNQDLEKARFEGQFDLIIMNHVFEHIKNLLGLVEQIGRHLSATGKLLIVVPNRFGFHNSARIFHADEGRHFFFGTGKTSHSVWNK